MALFTGVREFEYLQEVMKMSMPVIRDLVEYEEPERIYEFESVPVGYNKFTDGEEYTINFSKSKRILILGATGSGKTVLTNSIIDRFVKSGGQVAIFDLKGEYVKKYKPLQSKFHRFLLSQEQPQGFSIKTYYPYFLAKFTHRNLTKHERLAQFSLMSLSKPDFVTLLEDMTTNNPKLYAVLELLWDEISKLNEYSWDEIMYQIDEMGDIHPVTKKVLKLQLEALKKNGVLGDMYDPPNFIEDLNKGLIPILNLQGMTNYAQANSPASVYTAILLRHIYNAKVMKRIPKDRHTLIVIDEVNKYCPKLGEPSSKKEFLKLIDLSRSEKISIVYSTQDYKRIPDTLLTQANYVFLSYKTSLNDLAEIFKLLLPEEYDNPQTFKSEKIAPILADMKKYKSGARDWLVINRDSKTYDIIVPACPLSHLVVEGEET